MYLVVSQCVRSREAAVGVAVHPDGCRELGRGSDFCGHGVLENEQKRLGVYTMPTRTTVVLQYGSGIGFT